MEENNIYQIMSWDNNIPINSLGYMKTMQKELESQLIYSFGTRKLYDSKCVNIAIETIVRSRDKKNRTAAYAGIYTINQTDIHVDIFLIDIVSRIEMGENLYYSNSKHVGEIDFKMRFLDEVIKKRFSENEK
jgi:hypothetical protein